MSVLDNALQALFSGQVKIEKVWENANTSSAFPEQTISINLQDAVAVLIEAVYAAGYSTTITFVVFKGSDAFLNAALNCNLERHCVVQSSGVSFYEGMYYQPYGSIIIDDNRLVPKTVYKLKQLPIVSGGGHRLIRNLRRLFSFERRCAVCQ